MLESDYKKCLKSMFALRTFGIKFGLATIKGVLNKLGNPEKSFHSVHVAGTNGKGSVASALSSVLLKAGYKVGLYTSPHLIKFNERIAVNGISINDETVVDLWNTVKSAKKADQDITFFEFSTAMAFCEFERKNVDFAIIEAGMGGKLDATNVITPVLSIITNISIEHKHYLGNTIKKIAREKAGIIKPRVPIISGITQKSATNIIKEISNKNNSELIIIKRNFRTRKNKTGTFTYYSDNNRWENMHTNLLGDHQIDNAAISLAACEVLNRKHAHLPITQIRSGLSDNQWHGRIEFIHKSPCLILDGAHNLMAMKNLKNFIKKNLTGQKLTLVVGILNDKPYKKMLEMILPFCHRVFATQPKNDRALSSKTIGLTAKTFCNNVEIIPDVNRALTHAIETSNIEDTVCVAGSLYVVGEALESFRKKPQIL